MASLKGGKDSPDNEKGGKNSSMGFQPIPGVVSPTIGGGMMSPPPMLMPTPIHSLIGAPGAQAGFSPGTSGSADNPHAAMAFTYVPVPVYNMGGVSIPGMQGGIPGTPGMFPVQQPSSPDKAKDSSPKDSGKDGSNSSSEQVSLEQQQMMYQQAFIQNAVAQNMQIQQQLMMQNQALTHLLGQSGASSNNASMMGTPMGSIMNPPSMFNTSKSHAFMEPGKKKHSSGQKLSEAQQQQVECKN